MTRIKHMAASLPIALAFLAGSAGAISTPADMLSLSYDIERKGDVVGAHHVSYSQNPSGEAVVTIDAKVRVKFGFITVFRLDHESTEIWADNQLESMVSTTRRNKKEEKVVVRSHDEFFEVDSDEGVATAPLDLVPSSFTKPDFWIEFGERQFTLLDTLSGLTRPSVLVCGDPVTLVFDGQAYDTTYYSIKEVDDDRLSHEFWIDADGYLIKGILHTKDGETLVYKMAEA